MFIWIFTKQTRSFISYIACSCGVMSVTVLVVLCNYGAEQWCVLVPNKSSECIAND